MTDQPENTANHRSLMLISQWFPPEHAPMGYMLKELAEHMAGQGWAVDVVTGFPNHPSGKVFEPYRKKLLLREQLGNIRVNRLWLFTSERRSLITRALNFLSFMCSVLVFLLFRKPPALVFAVMQPLPIGAMLTVLARIKGFKLILNVQDLHPDVMVDLGLIRNPMLIRFLRKLETTGYLRADALAVICEGFKGHVRQKGSTRPVAVIPNWIDIDEIHPRVFDPNPVCEQAGISQGSHVVLYAGTLGHVSGAQVAIEAARHAAHRSDVVWLFVGEGPIVDQLKTQAQGLPQVRFLPFQPRSRLLAVQNAATVSIVSLLPGKGLFSVPSKVLGYMAAAKPVVASVDADSETGRLVGAAGCGLVCQPGQGKALADAVLGLVDNPSQAQAYGASGRQYLEAHFSKAQVCGRYQALFDQVLLNQLYKG